MPDQRPRAVSHRRGGGLRRLGHGLHRLEADGSSEEGRPDDDAILRTDAAAWQTLLPDSACFGHLTSARLRGLWLPPLPADLPIFVAQHRRHGASSRRELRVARHPVDPEWEERDGARLLRLPDTLLACARDLGVLDLVVLIDCALHHGWCDLDELIEAAGQRRRGAPALRAALALADARSESAWETLLRLLHVACDIAVTPQHELRDATGGFVARGDLWLVGSQVFHEYDGADHLDRRRQRRDLRRGRRIGHERWERRGYTKDDVLTQGVTILRDADATIGREHEPGRIRAWHDLLRGSLFTPAGTALFRARIGLPPLPDQRAS